MANPATGQGNSLIVDFEQTLKNPYSAGSRRPRLVRVINESLSCAQNRNQVNTIRNINSQDRPYLGNIIGGGQIVIPMDAVNPGIFFEGFFGAPLTNRLVPATDIKDGSPTVTVASGDGSYTFSEAQDAVARDAVILTESGGTRRLAYITTRTDSTTGTLSYEQDATTPVPNGTYTVTHIITNLKNSSATTVTISSNVATFSNAQSGLTAGMLVIYSATTGGAFSTFRVGTVTSTTVCQTLGPTGFPDVANVVAAEVEAVIAEPYFDKVWTLNTSAQPSMVAQRTHGNLASGSAYYVWYRGLIVGQMQVQLLGDKDQDARLVITPVICDFDDNTTQYETSVDDRDFYGDVYTQQNANVQMVDFGGSLADEDTLTQFSLDLNNNIDTTNRAINERGALRSAPRGIGSVPITMEAMFENTDLLTDINAEQVKTAVAKFQNDAATEWIKFRSYQILFDNQQVQTPGPQGLKLNLTGTAYYDGNSGNADASAVAVVVRNKRQAYNTNTIGVLGTVV